MSIAYFSNILSVYILLVWYCIISSICGAVLYDDTVWCYLSSHLDLGGGGESHCLQIRCREINIPSRAVNVDGFVCGDCVSSVDICGY